MKTTSCERVQQSDIVAVCLRPVKRMKKSGKFGVRLVSGVTIMTTRFDRAKPGFKLGHDVSVRRRRRRFYHVDGLKIRFRRREMILCLILCGKGCHHQFRCSNTWNGERSLWVARC